MVNSSDFPRAQTFFVQLWQEDRAARPSIILRNAQTDERLAFADLNGLMAYLQEMTAPDTPDRPKPEADAGRMAGE